ncbi:MAG TPA: response regulator [Candidatus Methylomirabilis sp.]|nr:response regulator [Candidatus Methylomirabilis sp.]
MATPTHPPAKTVLIIDDQPFFVTMQQNLLQRQGYRVVTASNGQEGLAKAKQHKPDLILLDIEMPGMDGFTVCEKLKQDEHLKHVPVIVLTSTQDAKLNERAFKAGAEITLLKSVPADRMLNMLRIAIEKGKMPPLA